MNKKIQRLFFILMLTVSMQLAANATPAENVTISIIGNYINVSHTSNAKATHYISELRIYKNGTLVDTLKFNGQTNMFSQIIKEYPFADVREGDKLTFEAICNKGDKYKKDIIANHTTSKKEAKKEEKKEEVKGLTHVPDSWNGDYADERKPNVKALTIKHGKIYTVAGTTVIETFPGKSSLKYKNVYSENECSQSAGSTVETKFVRESRGKIKYYNSGSVTSYLKMK